MRSLLETVQITKSAARNLAKLDNAVKNLALEAIAEAISKHSDQILEANQKDVANALAANLAAPLIARLKLNPNKIAIKTEYHLKPTLSPIPQMTREEGSS